MIPDTFGGCVPQRLGGWHAVERESSALLYDWLGTVAAIISSESAKICYPAFASCYLHASLPNWALAQRRL